MTKDEALKLALEAFGEINWSNNSQWQSDRAKVAITGLRLVIDAENISSKPVAWEQFYPEMGSPKLSYLSPTESFDNACYTPPQRTWVGLTDEDKESFWTADQMTGEEWRRLFAEVEAKLKEKNT